MLKLKVINIDSPFGLTHHDCAFTEQVIFMAEDLDKTEKRWNSENSISPLLGKVPLLLLSDESMPDLDFLEEDEKKWDEPPIEYLGFYTRSNMDCHYPSLPSIYICPERIKKHSNRRPQDITYQELVAKVIIHEFAHAIMDLSKENATWGDPSEKFFRWVEEPFANWFVMKYFDSYGQGAIFCRIKDFMLKQPKNYRLGWNFFNSKISDDLWKKWRIRKTQSINGNLKKQWVDYVQKVNIGDDVTQKIKELLK